MTNKNNNQISGKTDNNIANTYSGITTGIINAFPWNGSASTYVTAPKYSSVELIDTLIFEDRIELVYKGVLSLSTWSQGYNIEIWKNVYGCVDGKFSMIEHVIGEYIPAQDESYSF
jgi:hypothetical protein